MGESKPTPPSSSESSPTDQHSIRILLHNATLNDNSGSEALGFIRSSASTVAKLHSLPKHTKLLLFTPAVPPPSTHHDSASRAHSSTQPVDFEDPFEPLGRAINRYHSKVWHVPFVPNVGMTETHSVLLQQAGAIVLVVRNNDRDTDDQISFTRDLLAAAQPRAFRSRVSLLHGSDGRRADNSDPPPPLPIPALLLVVAEGVQRPGEQKLPRALDAFDTVLGSASYTAPALQAIAECVFSSS